MALSSSSDVRFDGAGAVLVMVQGSLRSAGWKCNKACISALVMSFASSALLDVDVARLFANVTAPIISLYQAGANFHLHKVKSVTQVVE